MTPSSISPSPGGWDGNRERKQSRREREIEEEAGQYSAQCLGVFPRSWLVHEPSGGPGDG